MLADPNQPAAPAKPKRKKKISPTQLSLIEIRKQDYHAQVVEHWNQHAKIRQDLFGVIDVVAIPKLGTRLGVIGIQATSGTNHAGRVNKIRAEPLAHAWVAAGLGLEVWSWAQPRGPGTAWVLRRQVITLAEFH